jgi:hypothetical protein
MATNVTLIVPVAGVATGHGLKPELTEHNLSGGMVWKDE